MALVNVTNIVVLDNPATFSTPYSFEITFECLQELEDDLEWKVLYVSQAADATRDLILEEVLVGPVPVGMNQFVLTANAPDPQQLVPDEELLGVTVVLVTCSYRDREFVRVGYYVNHALMEDEEEKEEAEEKEKNIEKADNDTETNSDSLTESSNNNLEQSTIIAHSKEASSGNNAFDDPMTASRASPPSPPPRHAIPSIPSQPQPPPPPPPPISSYDLTKIVRQILADKPRVTKFPIPWDDVVDTDPTKAASLWSTLATSSSGTIPDSSFQQETREEEMIQDKDNDTNDGDDSNLKGEDEMEEEDDYDEEEDEDDEPDGNDDDEIDLEQDET